MNAAPQLQPHLAHHLTFGQRLFLVAVETAVKTVVATAVAVATTIIVKAIFSKSSGESTSSPG